MRGFIILHNADNVAVVTTPEGLAAGVTLPLPTPLTAVDAIPSGHKVATNRIAQGAPVRKFGHVIGVATQAIDRGQHVHVHNVAMPPTALVNEGGGIESHAVASVANLPQIFQGYKRLHGRAGVRNYVVVVSSVNCSATVVKAVCRRFGGDDLRRRGVDGVVPVTHQSGCAQAMGGLSHQVLNRTLAGWMFHPNVVGAVVIGLGCEGTTAKTIFAARDAMGLVQDIPVETLTIQDVGGTAAAIEAGTQAVQRVLASLPTFQRQALPVSQLNLALNCGGSDAFSSLTANPVLGLVSDMLAQLHGTVALAEIPECTGAEDLLYSRITQESVRVRLQETFAWWDDYAQRQKVELNNNLAPGNIAGGITTIVEKSLGAVAKSGSTALTEVVGYAHPIHEAGFTLMNTPGFDPVSVTGLVAGGCNMVAFTTGRGSVYGCAIAPTLKIATTTELFKRMASDMDVDAGRVLADGTLTGVAQDLYRFVIEVASGKPTCSELLGLGWEEFVPWPIAETL